MQHYCCCIQLLCTYKAIGLPCNTKFDSMKFLNMFMEEAVPLFPILCNV